jgi:hypothetical protein
VACWKTGGLTEANTPCGVGPQALTSNRASTRSLALPMVSILDANYRQGWSDTVIRTSAVYWRACSGSVHGGAVALSCCTRPLRPEAKSAVQMTRAAICLTWEAPSVDVDRQLRSVVYAPFVQHIPVELPPDEGHSCSRAVSDPCRCQLRSCRQDYVWSASRWGYSAMPPIHIQSSSADALYRNATNIGPEP